MDSAHRSIHLHAQCLKAFFISKIETMHLHVEAYVDDWHDRSATNDGYAHQQLVHQGVRPQGGYRALLEPVLAWAGTMEPPTIQAASGLLCPSIGSSPRVNDLLNSSVTSTSFIMIPTMRRLISLSENITDDKFRDAMKHRDADKEASVSTLYHVTPESRLASIMSNGLEPRHENLQDEYAPRIYFCTSEDRAVKIAFQLRKALIHHKGQKRNWAEGYAVLAVSPTADVKFYKDGFSDGGVYTEQPIPSELIRTVGVLDGAVFLTKNWPLFWNWYFWRAKTPKPEAASRWPDDHRF